MSTTMTPTGTVTLTGEPLEVARELVSGEVREALQDTFKWLRADVETLLALALAVNLARDLRAYPFDGQEPQDEVTLVSGAADRLRELARGERESIFESLDTRTVGGPGGLRHAADRADRLTLLIDALPARRPSETT